MEKKEEFDGIIDKLKSLIFGKERNEDREITIDDVFLKIMFDLERQGFEYAYIIDLVQNEFTSSVIFSDNSKLYRADYSVVGEDAVSVSRIQEVKQSYKDVDRGNKFTLYRSKDDGKLKFMSIAASSVLNRVGEIDSTKLFDDLESNFNDDVYLTFQHYDEDFSFGKVRGVFRLDHLLFAYGEINEETVLGRYAERAFSSGEWGLSIGFQPLELPKLVDIGGVEIPTYNRGKLIEISVLKEDNAASYMTTILNVEGKMRTMGLSRKKAKEKLLEFVGSEGEDDVESLLDVANVREREIEENNLITREVEEVEEEEEMEVEEEVVEEVIEEEEEKEDSEEEIEVVEQSIEYNINREIIDEVTEIVSKRVIGVFDEKFEKYDEIFKGIDEKIRSIAETIENVNRQTKERLDAVEASEEKKVREAVDDLPSNAKKVVNVNYRPVSEEKVNSGNQSLAEIARATLENASVNR